ncbi:MAG: hypothetical protein ACRDTX_27005 [Pseudonocardiaceae bacterium]
MSTPDLAAFVAALPKVELRLHLIGSASPETVLTLARRHPDGGVPTEPAALRRFYAFTDFPHFLRGLQQGEPAGEDRPRRRHPARRPGRRARIANRVRRSGDRRAAGRLRAGVPHRPRRGTAQRGMSPAQLAELARAGARAAFCSKATRSTVLTEIDQQAI